LEGYRQLISRDTGQTLKHGPQLLQDVGPFFDGMAASQDAIQRRSRRLLATRIPRRLWIREKHHTDEVCGTFMTPVCIRVISFAIRALVSSDKKPSSVIAVYKGICLTSRSIKVQKSEPAPPLLAGDHRAAFHLAGNREHELSCGSTAF
jgi:hypothetical protein